MEQMKIERNARVMAPSGEVGRVKYVVVDRQSREVTHIVVDSQRKQYMVPIAEVAMGSDGSVTFKGEWSEAADDRHFNRERFRALDVRKAEKESQRRSLRGGLPLLGTSKSAVIVAAMTASAVEPVTPTDHDDRHRDVDQRAA